MSCNSTLLRTMFSRIVEAGVYCCYFTVSWSRIAQMGKPGTSPQVLSLAFVARNIRAAVTTTSHGVDIEQYNAQGVGSISSCQQTNITAYNQCEIFEYYPFIADLTVRDNICTSI